MLWLTLVQTRTPRQAETTIEANNAGSAGGRPARAGVSACRRVGESFARHPQNLTRLEPIPAHRVQLLYLLNDQPGVGVRVVRLPQ